MLSEAKCHAEEPKHLRLFTCVQSEIVKSINKLVNTYGNNVKREKLTPPSHHSHKHNSAL